MDVMDYNHDEFIKDIYHSHNMDLILLSMM